MAAGRSLAAAGACAALALLSACGDEGGGDFVAEGNRACEPRVALAERTADEERTDNADFAGVYEKELEALRKLEPPQSGARDFRRMLDLYGERTRGQRDLADLEVAIKAAPSRTEYGELVGRFSRINDVVTRSRVQGNELAAKLGLKTCARVLS